jgi:WhiB family redox-sensing transcriptional regulator
MNDWKIFGACRGVNPNLFYSLDDDDIEHAKSICGNCSVVTECLDYANNSSTREKEGIWGGQTEVERRRIRRNAQEHDRRVRQSQEKLKQAMDA